MATEQRLIDANALLENVQFRSPIDNKNAEVIAGCVDITRRLIENAPTVDAVEVVRCKDCDKSVRSPLFGRGWRFCKNNSQHHRDDHFCSYGERRTDNG